MRGETLKNKAFQAQVSRYTALGVCLRFLLHEGTRSLVIPPDGMLIHHKDSS